jgi:Rrf2 family protein
LEQVFALLKNSGVVQSIKGSQGGYQLTRSAEATTAFDVLSAVEPLLFEQTQEAVSKKAPEIDKVMGDSVFALLEESVVNTLKNITLDQLALEVEKCKASDVNMFYI